MTWKTCKVHGDDKPGAWGCPECLRELREENAKLRAFAQDVMGYWPEGAPDGGDLQELAEKHRLLKPETRHEPCGQECPCAECVDDNEWGGGVTCYRRTPLLMGPNV